MDHVSARVETRSQGLRFEFPAPWGDSKPFGQQGLDCLAAKDFESSRSDKYYNHGAASRPCRADGLAVWRVVPLRWFCSSLFRPRAAVSGAFGDEAGRRGSCILAYAPLDSSARSLRAIRLWVVGRFGFGGRAILPPGHDWPPSNVLHPLVT